MQKMVETPYHVKVYSFDGALRISSYYWAYLIFFLDQPVSDTIPASFLNADQSSNFEPTVDRLEERNFLEQIK